MKFSIDKSIFLNAINNVYSVVEKRNTIPILSNILISAEDGKISLIATDLEISMIDEVMALIDKPGKITTPAIFLHDVIKKMPDGSQITIELSDNSLLVSSGKSKFTLQTSLADDFPSMDSSTDKNEYSKITIPTEDMHFLIDKTKFAMSNEETRYYLNGIYFHKENNEIRSVATDGHRLAKAFIEDKNNVDIPGIIIPKKTVGEISKLLEQTDKDIDIEISKTTIKLKIGSVLITSKLIDGTFPDYEKVIPKNNTNSISINVSTFSNAVDRVSTVADGKMRTVKMKIKENNIFLSAHNSEAGSGKDEIEVEYTGSPIEIGFNASYLLDITRQIDTKECEFLLSESSGPSIIKDKEKQNTLYVLMPMRV